MDTQELLSSDEIEIAKRLAAGDASVKTEAESIYSKRVSAYVNGGRKSMAMNFLSEYFAPCPDLMLRAMYRKQLLAPQPDQGPSNK